MELANLVAKVNFHLKKKMNNTNEMASLKWAKEKKNAQRNKMWQTNAFTKMNQRSKDYFYLFLWQFERKNELSEKWMNPFIVLHAKSFGGATYDVQRVTVDINIYLYLKSTWYLCVERVWVPNSSVIFFYNAIIVPLTTCIRHYIGSHLQKQFFWNSESLCLAAHKICIPNLSGNLKVCVCDFFLYRSYICYVCCFFVAEFYECGFMLCKWQRKGKNR